MQVKKWITAEMKFRRSFIERQQRQDKDIFSYELLNPLIVGLRLAGQIPATIVKFMAIAKKRSADR